MLVGPLLRSVSGDRPIQLFRSKANEVKRKNLGCLSSADKRNEFLNFSVTKCRLQEKGEKPGTFYSLFIVSLLVFMSSLRSVAYFFDSRKK